MARPYYEALQEFAKQYVAAGGQTPYTIREVANWVYDQGLWDAPRQFLVSKLSEDLGKALREQYITDPQGRRVRAKHAVRMSRDEGEQGWLWDDMRTAPHEFLQMAFQQRRQDVVADCLRLKTDVDSYNDNRNPIEPIQLSLDFTNDVLEMELVPA